VRGTAASKRSIVGEALDAAGHQLADTGQRDLDVVAREARRMPRIAGRSPSIPSSTARSRHACHLDIGGHDVRALTGQHVERSRAERTAVATNERG